MCSLEARVTERGRPLFRSVFVKLVSIMLAMAVTLLVLVSGFFVLMIYSHLSLTTERLVDEYTRAFVATLPDLAAAQRAAQRLDAEIRYEGPRGTWSTSARLPAIADVRNGRLTGPAARRYYDLEAAPDGGTYLFAWNFGRGYRGMHTKLLWLLLFLMIGVVLAAYAFQRRLLRPIRWLDEGVAGLSSGRLDVAVPVRTHDEFGVLTQAFNQMVKRVSQMVRARDQLLLDVSHELRSPLTRLKVALEFLPEGEQRAGMAADVDEMERMVTELLELERLRNGRGVRMAHQDLLPILREVAGAFRDRPPGVREFVSEREIIANVDAERIRTVLRNLLENAFKYSLPDSRPVELSASQSGDSIALRVSDDGPGIPESDLENIFEPFFRVDRSRSKSTGGYGLGLSICKRIMEAHGGTITVERKPGRGTTFLLILPKVS
jgi:signal transduction histidine kinase